MGLFWDFRWQGGLCTGTDAAQQQSGCLRSQRFHENSFLLHEPDSSGRIQGRILIICDPKSELYEKSSEYLREKGYTVRVFNLVNPENSDSWNCLAEIEGQELMAQLFVDVIIKNTGQRK